MNFGCDYYPEHWPEEKWEKDARMMAEAGFNVVRLAEFAWLAAEHPDILRINKEGTRTSFGERRACCPNSSTYRTYSKKIVSKMAEHYKDNKNVIGWQIDNEFGGER